MCITMQHLCLRLEFFSCSAFSMVYLLHDVSTGAVAVRAALGSTLAFDMCVPEILEMWVAAQIWNEASRYGPCCELLFFPMRREPGGELGGVVPARSTRTESIPQAGIGRICFLKKKEGGA